MTNKKFYIAKHKPTNKFFKFNELCEDGWGFYEPNLSEIDLTYSHGTPDFFTKPEIRSMAGIALNSSDFRNEKYIDLKDIEWFELEIKISLIKT